MLGQRVHHHGESQQVTPGGKQEKQQLSNFQHLPTNTTHQDIACIGHAVDERITLSELTDHIAGICRDKPQTNDKDDGSKSIEKY